MKRFQLFLFLLLAALVFSSPVLAADSTSFDPTKVMVQSVATSSIPVGTVIAWPSTSWPSDADNWLECNGQAISSAVYPELVALIGTTVPDYRGIFLRGHGSQVSTHYGTVTHASAGLGELQGDAIRPITGHIIDAVAGGKDGHWGSTGGAFYGGSTTVDGADPSRHGPDYWNIYFDASRVTPVADEIRPVNRSVRYLIRAR